ncbi:hypothetical protein MTZ49_01680 [Entomomonas sp. E2T0]|uniref:hypothetical protein n=1 Tax=Entomomonas sp. E2T0 TaxID=2930213 RepID=UPI0022280EB9|nr:hypothetical protein [Entomomonas sp. E2T0]UYZ84318.1 hypothetical protein MTZ49_01680 [Entomomonas sp. E2T0]
MSKVAISTLNNEQLRQLIKNKISSRRLSKYYCCVLVDYHSILLCASIMSSSNQSKIIDDAKKLLTLMFGETVNSSLVNK